VHPEDGRPAPTAVTARWFTPASLVALALGIGLGVFFHGSRAPWVTGIADLLEPIGAFWVRALNLLVIPLIVSLSILAVLDTPAIGRLGARSIGVFAAMLAAGGLLSCLVAPILVSLYHPDPATSALLRAATTIPSAALAVDSSGGMVAWLQRYVPRSLDSVVRGAWVLVLLVTAIAGALVLRRVARSRLVAVHRGARWIAELITRVVRWVVLIAPLGIFALSFSLGLRAGGRAAGFMLAAILIVPGMLLLAIALLYPATALLARIPIARFARAAAPAQLVAASTQSSLATLPALVASARDHLGLPVAATGFVLPLAVSVFKFNRTVSGPTQLILLAHAFGVELAIAPLVLFVCASFLQSFFTPGVPGASSPYFTLPLYVAAGAPIEGVVILATIEPILDVFKTVTNVTADLSATAIVTRVTSPTT
jgi:proton glutamate symport protein